MRMKGRLTVYLVMVLCLVCAGALADCTHPNAYQSSRRENVEYESTGDLKEHKISYDLYQYMYCPNCGTRFSEISLGRQFVSGNHYWNSENTCLYCNQTNACKHSEEHVWFTERNYQYAQTGDTKTHSVTYDWYQITDCALCGLRLSESPVTTKTKNGNHNWNDSGICWSCGQENACVHEKQNVWFTSMNDQYQQTGDEKKHRLTYDWYKIVDCLQCGMRLSETLVDTKIVDSSHNWNNEGICQGCGQTNTCVHDKTHIGNETQNYRYEQIGDATKHRVTYDWYQVTYCTLCEQRLTTSGVETKTEIQSHNWNETGICWSCGQVNGCSHSETTVENETRDYRYEQIGDVKNHRVTYDQYEITECKLCGQRISEIYAETKTEHQSHFWNNAGICSGCGQGNICAHGETSSWSDGRHYQYQQTGDVKTHQVTYDRYEITDCALCGLRLSEDYVATITDDWSHSWNDEGICWDCGQENACAHGKTSSWTTNRNHQYQQTGDVKTHQVTYDRYRITECSLCGLQISEDYMETVTENRNHNWNDSGICRVCGQENICAHESVVESAYSTDHQYTKIDTNTHLLAFTVKIRRRCSVCNQTLDERMGGQYEVEQRHSWSSDGICWNCGETNTCEHKRVYDDSSRKKRYTDTGDGLHHYVKEDISFYKDCVDCGLRIDVHKETNEYTEEHAEKYRCWKCDYKAECPHEGTRYEAVDSIDMRYAVINERRHALYGRTETHVYCSDCDEELSATQSEAEELLNTEKHSWNNEGICYECGFKNPCTHGNTDVRLMSVDRFCVARNDATHTQTVIYKEVTCCADCGVTLGEISSLKKVVQTEAHTFDNGRCWACGFINRCSHDGPTHTGTEFGDWWDTVCIDDKTHKVDREILSTVYCDLCGEIVSQESLGRQWIVQEHEMYEDRCEHCNYRIACAHEATVEKLLPDSDYLFCESISDNAHAATCRLVAYECCESCGVLLEGRTVGTTKVNEPHNIVNHRCVECGYCEHPAEQIETTRDYIPSERRYEKYNEYTHLYNWGSSLYTSVCRLCGDTVKEWLEEGGTSVETHNYGYDGVCRGCGYKNTCRHDNAYRASEMQHYAYVDIGDDEQHESVRRERTFMFCPDCLYRWDDQPGTAEDVRLENHYYNTRNGKCSWCGHKNPCEHRNTELIQQDLSLGFGNNSCYSEFIDEDYHAVYCTDRYEYEKCLDCGLKLSRKYVECEPVLVMAKQEHWFDDSGKCWCGYVNPHPCEHLNTVTNYIESFSYYWLQCDDTHHKRVQLGRVGVFCADCGEKISATNQIEELVTYQEHSFNKQGVCQSCYYVKKCKHLETQINRYCEIYNYSIIDDTCHEIHHVIREVELCLSCGMAIKGEKLEESIAQQPHDGKDACSLCGWRSPEHICEWKLHDYSCVISAKAIDALTHEAVIQRKAYQYCRGCGDEGSVKILPVEKVVESHHFTDLGRCEDCGYVNFCKHKETYEKQILEPLSGRTAKDEFEHTLIADVTTETRCKFCNQRLSFTAALNVECTEEHVFDSVADLVCDLCGYEREAPEEAATPEPTPTTTPEPTNTPAPTKKPGGGNTGSGSSGDTTPSKPKNTATPTPEEALPKTGDESMPMSILLMVMVVSLCGLGLMAKRKHN